MAWCQLSYVLHGWYLIVSAENSLGVSWLEILTGESLQSSDNLHVPFQGSLFEILIQGWWGQTKSLWFPRGMRILAQLVILQEFTQQIKAQINAYWVCGKLEDTHHLWDRCWSLDIFDSLVRKTKQTYPDRLGTPILNTAGHVLPCTFYVFLIRNVPFGACDWHAQRSFWC